MVMYMNKKKGLVFTSIIFLITSICSIGLFFYLRPFYSFSINNNINIKNIKNNGFKIKISNLSDDIKCGFSYSGDNNIHWSYSSKCNFNVHKNIEKVYLKKLFFTRSFSVSNLVLSDNLPKKLYLALNDTVSLNEKIDVVSSMILYHISLWTVMSFLLMVVN